MPNLTAYLVLIIWPLISILMFKRLRPLQATFWTIIGGYLLLPTRVSIDFPLIPPLTKESISTIAALVGYKFIKKKSIYLIPRSGLERWLFIVLLLTPFVTMMNNQEPFFNGEFIIPGLSFHDALSATINQYIRLIPFLLGLTLIKTHEDQLMLFKLLVIAGLWYSLPILYEIRMSPQLHTSIYGFFPHSFVQQFRFGGFRPVVFIGHGLFVALFVAVTLGAATLLWKEKIRIYNISAITVVVYLFILLLLCKTVGALLLGLALILAIGWLHASIINRLALLIMLIVIFYPILSVLELFPHQYLLDMAKDFDVSRAESLAFRFHNEHILLEHAQEKFYFGWGGWGRNRFADSTTDGYWIIQLGQYGIVGFFSLFGLAFLSVWSGISSKKLLKNKNEQQLLAGHTFMVAIIMADQLPNASLSPWLLFIVGSLLGRSNYVIKNKKISV